MIAFGVTAPLALISIRTPSAPGTTFTRCSWFCALATGFAAGAGFAGAAPGMTAGFTDGAGAPGAGFKVAYPVVPLLCCSALAVLRALSMASGFWAKAAPAVIVIKIEIARMPVFSFIESPYFAAGAPGLVPAAASGTCKS